jgi:hypothetical protein
MRQAYEYRLNDDDKDVNNVYYFIKIAFLVASRLAIRLAFIFLYLFVFDFLGVCFRHAN